jgi:hypothetical protein
MDAVAGDGMRGEGIRAVSGGDRRDKKRGEHAVRVPRR